VASYRKRGGVWHIQIRRQGYPAQTKTFNAKTDADRWVRGVERGLDLGHVSFNNDTPKATYLCDVLARYRDNVSINKRGHDVEKWRLNAISQHWLGKCSLHQVSSELISKYRDERLDIVCGATVLSELNLIRHCLKIAINEWGVDLSSNPVDGVRMPSSSSPRNRRLMEGELDTLLLGCLRGRTPLLAPVIQFAIETGMRRGEIVNARWSDLDCDKCTLHIPITKNGSSRTIPMTDKAMQTVQGLAQADERFFPTTGNAIRLAWVRLKKRVGITDLRFHDLRHEAVSRFFEMGLSVPEVALISGHKDPRMLFRYTHLRAEDVGKKLNRGLRIRDKDV